MISDVGHNIMLLLLLLSALIFPSLGILYILTIDELIIMLASVIFVYLLQYRQTHPRRHDLFLK